MCASLNKASVYEYCLLQVLRWTLGPLLALLAGLVWRHAGAGSGWFCGICLLVTAFLIGQHRNPLFVCQASATVRHRNRVNGKPAREPEDLSMSMDTVSRSGLHQPLTETADSATNGMMTQSGRLGSTG